MVPFDMNLPRDNYDEWRNGQSKIRTGHSIFISNRSNFTTITVVLLLILFKMKSRRLGALPNTR